MPVSLPNASRIRPHGSNNYTNCGTSPTPARRMGRTRAAALSQRYAAERESPHSSWIRPRPNGNGKVMVANIVAASCYPPRAARFQQLYKLRNVPNYTTTHTERPQLHTTTHGGSLFLRICTDFVDPFAEFVDVQKEVWIRVAQLVHWAGRYQDRFNFFTFGGFCFNTGVVGQCLV